MSLLKDLRVLFHLVLSPVRGASHAERLESFYHGQAGVYDQFRERLLQGRRELFDAAPLPDNGLWVDMGAGTGSSLDYMAHRVRGLRKGYLVDLSPSLLDVARKRLVQTNLAERVEAVLGDVSRFVPPEGQADLVTFSYSLTMIPNWFEAIEHAWRILRPGGRIAVVDFYVSRKHPEEGMVCHSWATRSFWPVWFACDNVFPNPDHLPFLQARFKTEFLKERRARLPYLPLARAPYYLFIGCKP